MNIISIMIIVHFFKLKAFHNFIRILHFGVLAKTIISMKKKSIDEKSALNTPDFIGFQIFKNIK